MTAEDRPRPGRPGPAAIVMAATGAFFALVAVLASQMAAGRDPKLGATVPNPKPATAEVVHRRVIVTTIVSPPRAPAAAPPPAVPATTTPPAVTTRPVVRPAPAPAPAPPPVQTHSS